MRRLGVIDIGTNSVLLTIAEQDEGGAIVSLYEGAEITRIGEGLGHQSRFLPEAMERTAERLERYAAQCQQYQVEKIVAVGTAAFRKAENAHDFVHDIQRRCRFTIDIISGEREAELAYLAASQDFGQDLLVLDIGGGSTEFIWQTDRVHGISLDIGSVVLHEQLCHSDPISDHDYEATREAIVRRLLASHGSVNTGGSGLLDATAPSTLVALAGTATTLVAMHKQLVEYVHAEVHGTILRADDIAHLLKQLRRATFDERKQMLGLEPKRADVILSGAILLNEVMHLFGYDKVTISDRGVRWGLLVEAFPQQLA